MKNKIISLALAVITLFSLFALTACSGDGGEPCDHSTKSAWKFNTTEHWKVCDNAATCGSTDKFDLEEHTYDADNKCTKCNYEKGKEVIDYPWSSTTLKFQLTDNTNGGELSSECRRYIQGDSPYTDPVDTGVIERNALCKAATKVDIEYSYLTNDTIYNWGQVANKIFTTVTTQSKNCPDMFCNFVYDMVNASLKGCFANLNATDRNYNGANYFEFVNENGNDPYYTDKVLSDGTTSGYMYEYMRSLTLSRQKMYLVSSDYFTDMVRAFYVIPVNSYLMNTSFTADNNTAHLKDRTGDGVFNMDDFFKLVTDKEWNYETMMEYCKAVANDEHKGTGTETYDLRDTVGFALDANSGLSASGILYSTTITVINRDFNFDTREYDFSYNSESKDLENFCTNLKKLFDEIGVISVIKEENYENYHTENGDGSASDAIRARFAANKVLFGNIICVGALEDSAYQRMQHGFGVVPVPLYRTNYVNDAGETVVDPYLTSIHNLGRIGAIAVCSNNFAQCSAFLDYQSLNSKNILESYYTDVLMEAVSSSDAAEGNKNMLKYIRTNVRSSFDKVFEDAIAVYFSTEDDQATKNKWHEMIKNARYKLTTMSTKYESIYLKKQENLGKLKAAYESKS